MLSLDIFALRLFSQSSVILAFALFTVHTGSQMRLLSYTHLIN